VVEQRTENPRVSGSTPLLGTNYQVIEHDQVCSRIPTEATWMLNGD
jgi:hypothetical protein